VSLEELRQPSSWRYRGESLLHLQQLLTRSEPLISVFNHLLIQSMK
jgi:hypothetical protein